MSVTKIRGNTQIIDGSILNAQIDAAAAIAESKLALDYSTSGLNTSISNHVGDTSNPHSVTKSQVLSGDLIVNSDIDASAAIAYSKLNLTGSIVEGDLASALETTLIRTDGSQAFAANQSMGSNKLTDVADPTNDQDAATKSYVDSVAAGLDPKGSVRAATDGSDVTSLGSGGAYSSGQFTWTTGPADIDGVTLSDGDRILVKDQTTATQNGIYVRTSSTQWDRASDMDGTPSNEVSAGNFTFVEQGTANADSGWVVQGDGDLTLDTDNINWTQFSDAGQITAGAGLTKTGTTVDVVAADQSMTVNADSVQVKLDATAATLQVGGAGLQVADGTAGQILIGKGAGTDTAFTAISGDITLAADGTTAIAAGAIVDADVNASAAIAYSKLNLTGSIVNADVNASAAIDESKLSLDYATATLNTNISNHIADTSNPHSVTKDQVLSGDLIDNADIDAAAAIAFSKLEALTSGNILVGNGSNVATSVAMSGDATIDSAGVVTLASDVLKEADYVAREVPSGTIDGSNTSFILANTPVSDSEHVYLNGILQNEGASNDYTISGATITFNTAPTTGDVLLVSYLK